jgi:anti-sigma factor RsiW
VTGSPQPIPEEDLHAYVDGQLDPSGRAAVERYLAADPEEAQRISAYSAQREALRAALASRAAGPLPPELDLSRLIEARLTRRQASWRPAVATVLLLALGGASGWLLNADPFASRNTLAMSVLQQQALATHVVYAADRRHPIEVGASEREHLAQWLSNRLARRVAPPDLSVIGYHLIGGRLLATERGSAAALFMYENDAHTRLSVVLRPMAPELRSPQKERTSGAVNLCAWIENGIGYAVVATLPDSELDRASEYIRTGTAAGG